ncbi:uncharacterized protein BDV14DRAFT_176970 [Aspergillus stella-maris]|uniref:uncharacterized protein n=1 Tax=Aspergillus stella-maris TaxID=1810926 RepID=UPI003CCDF8B9
MVGVTNYDLCFICFALHSIYQVFVVCCLLFVVVHYYLPTLSCSSSTRGSTALGIGIRYSVFLFGFSFRFGLVGDP